MKLNTISIRINSVMYIDNIVTYWQYVNIVIQVDFITISRSLLFIIFTYFYAARSNTHQNVKNISTFPASLRAYRVLRAAWKYELALRNNYNQQFVYTSLRVRIQYINLLVYTYIQYECTTYGNELMTELMTKLVSHIFAWL